MGPLQQDWSRRPEQQIISPRDRGSRRDLRPSYDGKPLARTRSWRGGDRDERFGNVGVDGHLRVHSMVWPSPYVERVIGSIRRECLNHLIVLSQEHLRKVLNGYVRYYNNTRPHESLGKNSPIPRVIESAKKGPIISIPEVGGLHHRYQRAA